MDFSKQEQGQCKDDADDEEYDGEEDGHGARDLGCGGPHHSQKPKRIFKAKLNLYWLVIFQS